MKKVKVIATGLLCLSASLLAVNTSSAQSVAKPQKKILTLYCSGGGGLLLKQRLTATLTAKFEAMGLSVAEVILDIKDRSRPSYVVYEEIGGVQVFGSASMPKIKLSTQLNDSIASKNCTILRTLNVKVVLNDGRTITAEPFQFRADGKFLLP